MAVWQFVRVVILKRIDFPGKRQLVIGKKIGPFLHIEIVSAVNQATNTLRCLIPV